MFTFSLLGLSKFDTIQAYLIRKPAQKVIQPVSIASYEMLKSLFGHSPSAMIIADLDRNILDVNPSFCRIFQYEKSDVKKMRVPQLYVEVSEFERIRELVRRGSDKIGTKFYASYRRGDGTVFPGQASLSELFSDDGTLIGVAGIINDLTDINGDDVELLLGVEQLTAERSRQKTLYMRSPAMTHSINANGFIETVSDAWLRKFGYAEHEVVGKRSSDFLTPESRAFAIEEVLPELWKTGFCDRIPYTFVCSDGSLVEVELSAVLDETLGEPVTLAVLQDVTDRNASRRALEQRNQDLRDFAHIAAHDLQAPIRHMSVFADMLRSDLQAGEQDEVESSLQIIEKSALTLAEMIRSLLEFSISGRSAIVTQMNDTKMMIEDAGRILGADVSECGATITTTNLPSIQCDRALMMRVISNLIGNSLKYVPPGINPEILITGHADEQSTLLQFRDNGIGIPKCYREQVFKPLKRLHGADSGYSGTGIGLALCRRIIEAHGGTIQIGEAGDIGTLIDVRLPN